MRSRSASGRSPRRDPGLRVLIRVEAFGLNRSELHTRLGLAEGVTFPRVLGIEATGVVEAAPGGELESGQQVMTMMGGMGRQFDGGYAEYTCVPAAQVIPFHSDLGWATLGAVPGDAPDRVRLVDGRYIPTGVRLTGYSGEASDLPATVLQSFLDDVAAGRLKVPIDRTYTLDEIATAHADMEAGNALGKFVVLP